MSTQNSITDIPLNDCVPFILNNIQIQIDCIKRGDQCPVIFISGAPGIGKSDIMNKISKKLMAGLNPQYIGTMLIEQFGMPMPVTDPNATFQRWSMPELYSTDNLRVNPDSCCSNPSCECGGSCAANWDESGNQSEKTIILLLDDIHLADKIIQKYLFQLFTYRSIHNKKMPDNFVMVAAGNRSIDRAGAQPIMAPIVNRFFFVDVIATADDWINNFAIPHKINQEVISFIEYYPDLLQSEPLESKPWASPRSWTYFANALDMFVKSNMKLTTKDLITLAKGHIGLDYAVKFSEYHQIFCKWHVNSILDMDEALPKPLSKIDCYTLMSALTCELLKRLRAQDFALTGLEKPIGVIKDYFHFLIENAKEIIPLGFRSLVLSESITTKQASLYYQLVRDDEYLLQVTKQLLDIKTK